MPMCLVNWVNCQSELGLLGIGGIPGIAMLPRKGLTAELCLWSSQLDCIGIASLGTGVFVAHNLVVQVTALTKD